MNLPGFSAGKAPAVPPALSASGLSKRFGSVWALRQVDIAIEAGTITALIGPNGAGKSTLLRTWVGFERPTKGEARVFDADPWARRSRALAHIGYVPQAEALYSDFSPKDHFAFARRFRSSFDVGWANSRLEELGIPLVQPVRALSGGQRAQVMLTIALATKGEVLLLDEPLASLDPLARRDFLHLLTEVVRREGRTALLSSHVVADVEQACDAVVIIDQGRVVLHASIASAIDRHRIVPGDSTLAEGSIGTFRETSGERVTLATRSNEDDRPAGPPPTLEQIVLGYLSSRSDVGQGR